METPAEIGPAWDRALSADRPVVLDGLADPEVPPLPPHTDLKQALNMAKAVMKGDPGARDFVKQTFMGELRELFPASR